MTLYSRFFNKYNTVVNFSMSAEEEARLDEIYKEIDKKYGRGRTQKAPKSQERQYIKTRNLPTTEDGRIADPWRTPAYRYETIGYPAPTDYKVPDDDFDVWGDFENHPAYRKHKNLSSIADVSTSTLPKKPSFPTGKTLAVGAGLAGLGGLGYLAWRRSRQENKKQQRGKYDT